MTAKIEEIYAHERQKRMHPEGNTQYIDVHSPDLQDLGKDLWIDYEALAKADPPMRNGDRIKFLITGAGHNGILSAVRLIGAGFKPEDIVLVDVAGGYGGTWYWNRYPGLMCDVEGYCYLPLLEETGYVPKHKYSYGAEIRKNTELIAERWRLRGMFSTKVDRQVWDNSKDHWVVDLTQSFGDVRPPTKLTVNAQFVFMASGVLSTPKIPNVPGFEDFRKHGQTFHTSRWDYRITGGTQEQPDMTKLKDKNVAIIGTGATSVQAIPEVAKWAKHLYVIQRTPSYCGERGQKETTAAEWAKVADGPGWQYRRSRNLNTYISANPEPVDSINDGWTRNQARSVIIGSDSYIVEPGKEKEHTAKMLAIDHPIAEELRSRIDKVVKDPKVADKLKPWYPGWCKRPTFNDDYLESYNRSNVTLVDTDGKGIQGFTERGVLVNGEELDVNLLILGTGFVSPFEITPNARQAAPIIGRGGRPIEDKWRGSDFGTLFGVATHGFPNMFAYHLAGAGVSYNMTFTYDIIARLTACIIAEASRQSSDAEKLIIEPLEDGEQKWTSEVVKRAGWFSAAAICTPSYFTAEGDATIEPASQEEALLKARKAGWGGGAHDYGRIVDAYIARTENKLEGFLVQEVNTMNGP